MTNDNFVDAPQSHADSRKNACPITTFHEQLPINIDQALIRDGFRYNAYSAYTQELKEKFQFDSSLRRGATCCAKICGESTNLNIEPDSIKVCLFFTHLS